MGSTADVLVTAVLAMVKIFLVLSVGIVAATYPKDNPLLCRDGIRKMSRLSNYVFLPFLVASAMGSTIKPSKLVIFGPLIITQTLAFALALGLATLCERILNINRAMFRPLKLAIAFPNAGTVPLLLMEALCEQPLVSSAYDSSAQCFGEATGIIFIYLIGWHVWFFCWGFFKLGECKELDCPNELRNGSTSNNDDSCCSPEVPRGGGSSQAVIARGSPPGERQLVLPRPAGTQLASFAMASLHNISAIDEQTDRPSPPPANSGGKRNGNVRPWAAGAAAGRRRGAAAVADMTILDGDEDATQGSLSPSVAELRLAEFQNGGESEDVVLRGEGPAATVGGRKYSGTFLASQEQESTNSSVQCGTSNGRGRARSTSLNHGRVPRPKWLRFATRGPCGDGSSAAVALRRIRTALLSPPLLAVAIGVTIGLIPPLQSMLFFEPRSPLRPVGAAMTAVGTPLVALQTLIQAGSLLHTRTQLQSDGTFGAGAGFGLPRRQFVLAGALFVLCPLVIIPGVGFALVWLCLRQTALLGDNHLMQLVLLLQLAMPSAQLIIVTLAHLGLAAMAGHVAKCYIWQYAASAFTLTGFSALAMHIVYS